MVENIGNGFVKVGVKKEDLEESIAALQELKPILQKQVIIGNKLEGCSKKQIEQDVKELGKHFDTAIDAMTIIYSGFQEESENEEYH